MYCNPNHTFQEIWVNEGINPCFFDTVSVSVYGSVLIVFGLIRWAQYSKGFPIPSQFRPVSVAFWFQIAFSLLIPILSVVRFCLQSTVLGKLFFSILKPWQECREVIYHN